MPAARDNHRVAAGTLEGVLVRLEPLELTHLDALCEVGLDPDLWQLTASRVASRADMQRWIAQAIEERSAGSSLPFATIEKSSGRAVGATRFGNIDVRNRRAEIGWTWIAKPWQRSGVNTEVKHLMLSHAFERMDCVRVELKTDALNTRSREAILRLGAQEEGILRRHILTDSGRFRDTVYFSILDVEWPGVKRGLEGRMKQYQDASRGG